MSSRNAILLTCAVLCAMPFAAFSQDEERMPPGFRTMLEEENQNLPLREMRDRDLHELLQTILMVRLAQSVELTDEQILEFSKRVGTFKDQLHEMKWQIAASRESLRNSVEIKDPDAIVSRKLEDCLLQELAITDLLRKLVHESRKDLTEVQAAKFYLFLGDFEQEMRLLVDRAFKHEPSSGHLQHLRTPPALNNDTADNAPDPQR